MLTSHLHVRVPVPIFFRAVLFFLLRIFSHLPRGAQCMYATAVYDTGRKGATASACRIVTLQDEVVDPIQLLVRKTGSYTMLAIRPNRILYMHRSRRQDLSRRLKMTIMLSDNHADQMVLAVEV